MAELGTAEVEAVRRRGAQQVVDLHPAMRIEHQSDPFRLMPQVFRDVLRHLHGASFIHEPQRARSGGPTAAIFGVRAALDTPYRHSKMRNIFSIINSALGENP
ncbi:hypothetical protein Slala04_11400 [Streptomyces lavendulae subsp. lavendulae]|nr:hypothetical protein Slala04_11400 [Streptomyces lavendulae subsp. lavendulae]